MKKKEILEWVANESNWNELSAFQYDTAIKIDIGCANCGAFDRH